MAVPPTIPDSSVFPVKLRLRIDWSELDYFGHVNNVSFFKYIQASRVHYWEHIGLNQLHKETQTGPMLVSCTCEFRKPLFFPGEVILLSRIEKIGNTSFGIEHCLQNEAGETVADAHDVMVLYDFKTNTKVPLPDSLKQQIEALEGRKL